MSYIIHAKVDSSKLDELFNKILQKIIIIIPKINEGTIIKVNIPENGNHLKTCKLKFSKNHKKILYSF